jgi:RNA polymerase sigma-70 factor (ECF subfamily)
VATEKELLYQELLVLRCQRGDRAALQELITTWQRRLFYFLRRLGCEEADAWDLLQQTSIRVLRGIARLKEPRQLAPWLYRIARNTAIDHGKLRSLEHKRLEALAQDSEPEDDPGIGNIDDVEQIHHALLQLAVPHREVLTLFFLESMSVEQVADVLGVPPRTVKSRLHHAKRALRAVLTKEDSHDIAS